MSSHRIKNTAELREKFHTAFGKVQAIKAGEGLTKGELKKLERMGWVERVSTAIRHKYADVAPTKQFVWRRKVNANNIAEALKS